MGVVAGVNVSRETIASLELFAEHVLKWTSRINLISASTHSDIWDRHICDSVQLFQLVPARFSCWLDIGSGGGFPGIVAAIVGRQLAPDARFVLVESDQRKATFLRTAIRELELNAIIRADRIENLQSVQADIISARALGPLSLLLPYVDQHLHQDGRAIFHKGRQAPGEIALARQNWRFDLEERPSLTDPTGRLLLIQRISRVV